MKTFVKYLSIFAILFFLLTVGIWLLRPIHRQREVKPSVYSYPKPPEHREVRA